MSKYFFTGKRVDGQPTEGIRRASHPLDLQQQLLAEGIFLASHRITQGKLSQFISGRLHRKEITRLTRQLAALVSSDVNFNDALHSVQEQVRDKGLISVLEEVAGSIESGKSIADSFGQFPSFFDTVYVSLLNAGESSGTLDAALDRAAAYRERSEDVAKKITGALVYPLLVLGVTFVVVLVLIYYVIPVFASMYENFGSELPSLTKAVVDSSNFMKDHPFILLTALVLFAGGIGYIVLSDRARYYMNLLQLKVPLVNRIVIKIINARFAATLGLLLQSGVPILFSVEVAIAATGNRYAIRQLNPLARLLSEGKSLTEAMNQFSIFSPTLIRMTAAGEKTGRLGALLSKAAIFFETEIDHEIKTLTTLFEPMVIVLLGVFIAFILVAMYLPLFNLMNTM